MAIVLIIALVVVAVILFSIAVEQGNTIAKYERELMARNNKATVKKGTKKK